jgi:putative transcriptional regulator
MTLPREVLTGLDDVIKDLNGETSGGRTFEIRSRPINVSAIRSTLGLTQQEFAVRFGFPIKTLQNWEQGVREPEGPARAYLIVIKHNPSAVAEALAAERGTDTLTEAARS